MISDQIQFVYRNNSNKLLGMFGSGLGHQNFMQLVSSENRGGLKGHRALDKNKSFIREKQILRYLPLIRRLELNPFIWNLDLRRIFRFKVSSMIFLIPKMVSYVEDSESCEESDESSDSVSSGDQSV